jgi:hypothetical protein
MRYSMPVLYALLILLGSPVLEARSFDELFPALGGEKSRVLSEGGIIRSVKDREELVLGPSAASGIDILSPVLKRNPNYLAESLLLIPYGTRRPNLEDLYHSLSKVRDLKGRLYHSATRDENVPLFEDATRVGGLNRSSPLPDPEGGGMMPPSERVYIRLKDTNFGNTFYKADISKHSGGILYSLSNTKTINYLLFPVMKEDKFAAQLYLEALDEGVLVYSIAGTEVSDFIASRISIPSAVRKRLEVFIAWVSDGIRERVK